jgi:plasmid maintenance system antidote protein VapI
MGVAYTMFNEILNSKRPLTIEIAMLVEAALGVPAYILVGMQTDYNMQIARQDKTFAQRLAEIHKSAVV